jgi:hypothetical protein
MNPVTYTCEKCFQPFERASKPGGYRFCSHHCANQHAFKLGRGELLPYAEIGAKVGYIAKRLEVNPRTVREALFRHDLYRLWYSRRYKKCASLMDGSTSATTASNGATTPSAKSAVPMGGGMNYGG